MWWGVGLSLLVALGTLIFNSNAIVRPPQELEYKTRYLSNYPALCSLYQYTSSSDPDGEGTSSGRRRRRQDSEKERCVICLTEFGEGPLEKEFLPCFHCFHSQCIKVLTRYNRLCPVCRTKF